VALGPSLTARAIIQVHRGPAARHRFPPIPILAVSVNVYPIASVVWLGTRRPGPRR